MDSTVIPVVAIGLGGLVLIGAALLLIGDRWAARSPTKHGEFFATLHVVAIAAAIVGAVVAWFAFASDHPKKWLHLTMPIVFVAIVYGYALGFDRGAWVSLWRDLRDRVLRNAV